MSGDAPDLARDNEALKQSVVALILTLQAPEQLRVMHGLARRAEGKSEFDTVSPNLRVLWQVTSATAWDLLQRLLGTERA